MVVDLSRDGGEVVVVWSSEVGNADTVANLVPPKSGPMEPSIEHHEGKDEDQPVTQNYKPRSKLDGYGKRYGARAAGFGLLTRVW